MEEYIADKIKAVAQKGNLVHHVILSQFMGKPKSNAPFKTLTHKYLQKSKQKKQQVAYCK